MREDNLRIAKKSDKKKIEELKIKIKDEAYLLNAIKSIAHNLSENIAKKE